MEQILKPTLPAIDNNPDHQVPDGLLNENELDYAEARLDFLNFLKILQEKIQSGEFQGLELKFQQELLRINLELLELITSNQEGQVIVNNDNSNFIYDVIRQDSLSARLFAWFTDRMYKKQYYYTIQAFTDGQYCLGLSSGCDGIVLQYRKNQELLEENPI
jgi:hypothetical protein